MNKGIKITEYDLIDLEKWAEEGIESLKDDISKEEYDFLVKHTWQIDSYSEDIKKVLAHPNFVFKRQRPTWNDLQEAFDRGAVCEVVLDSVTLDGGEGEISLHRVVVLDIKKDKIIFHDPRTNKPRPARVESVELFKRAWLKALAEPELCVYEKE